MALIVLPLGRYSKEAYGKAFFSYPKFWMWMDDFRTEAYPFAATSWSRTHLEKLCPGDLPSTAWYFRRHTPRDAATRLWNGTREVVARFFFPERKLVWHAFFWRPDQAKWRQPLAHRGVYLFALAALCAVLLWPVRQTVLPRLLESGNLAVASFVLMVAMLYTLLYGWYLPRATGSWGAFGFPPFSSFAGWRPSCALPRAQKAPMRFTWACTLPFCFRCSSSAPASSGGSIRAAF